MRRIPSVVGLAALSLVLVACGSDGSDGGLSASDRKVIAAGLLREGDIPGAIKGLPEHSSSQEIQKLAERVPECAQFVLKDIEGEGDRDSNRYALNGIETSSSANMYPSATVAAEQMVLFTDPAFPACIQNVFRLGLGGEVAKAGGSLGTVTMTQLPPPAIGDGAFAYRLTIPIDIPGGHVELISDEVGVRLGRFSLDVTSGLKDPLTLTPAERDAVNARLAALDASLAPVLADRMRAACG